MLAEETALGRSKRGAIKTDVLDPRVGTHIRKDLIGLERMLGYEAIRYLHDSPQRFQVRTFFVDFRRRLYEDLFPALTSCDSTPEDGTNG